MKVMVYSTDGNLLFNSGEVGSDRPCDGTDCYPNEVREAISLALAHSDLPMLGEDQATFAERRQFSRMHRA